MKQFVFAAVVASGDVVAQNVLSSCGSSSDHFKDVVVTSSSTSASAVTVSIAGNLDEDIKGGNVDLDMNIEALNFINRPVKQSYHFTYTPGVPKGPVKVTVGPLSLPWLPGSNNLVGTIKITDLNKQPVACLGLNLPLMNSAAKSAVAPVNVTDKPTICSSPSDRIKNLRYTDTKDKFTVNGDFDEDVTAGAVTLASHIGIGWLPVPVNVNVPITYTPGFKKGPFEVVVTNQTQSQLGGSAMSIVDMYGTVKGTDGAGAELFCVKFDEPLRADTVVV